MWKLLIYPQWRYAEAEKFLADMESKGYRLETVKCSFFFKFKKTVPKKTKYVYLYHYMKDGNEKHFDAKHYLLGACGGTQVCGKRWFEPTVFRVTDIDTDISEVIKFRDSYLKRAFLLNVLTALILGLPSILAYVFYPSVWNNVLILIALIASVVILYHAVGVIWLSRGNL